MAEFEHNGEKIPTAPSKDPDSVVDYGSDYSQFLRDGEVISVSEWLVPAPLVNEGESFTDTTTTILLSGGVVNEKYLVTNRITTSLGIKVDRSMNIPCREN